jgi:outer membrane protein assembly factor BamB
LNANETILTPSNVNSTTFGKLFQTTLDGKVDGQPMYIHGIMINQAIHNVLIAATEHDSVYALDADTGIILWRKRTLGILGRPSDSRNCSQVVPEIGITGTPVIESETPPPAPDDPLPAPLPARSSPWP